MACGISIAIAAICSKVSSSFCFLPEEELSGISNREHADSREAASADEMIFVTVVFPILMA